MFFVHSEIRLMEIVEGLCDSSSFECNRMLEEHEDLFETWWFKRCESANANVFRVTLGGKLLVLTTLFHLGECGKLLFSCVVSCSNAGKQNILIFTSGSALKPSKCAVQKEHLDLTAMVRKSMSILVLLFSQYSLKVN